MKLKMMFTYKSFLFFFFFFLIYEPVFCMEGADKLFFLSDII